MKGNKVSSKVTSNVKNEHEMISADVSKCSKHRINIKVIKLSNWS